MLLTFLVVDLHFPEAMGSPFYCLKYAIVNLNYDSVAWVSQQMGLSYLNCNLSAWHNHYRDAVHHAVVPDVAPAISKYGCSQKGEMC